MHSGKGASESAQLAKGCVATDRVCSLLAEITDTGRDRLHAFTAEYTQSSITYLQASLIHSTVNPWAPHVNDFSSHSELSSTRDNGRILYVPIVRKPMC